MRPSEMLERCIQTGEGMTAAISGFHFTILSRSLPDEIPLRPPKPPLFRDVKGRMSQHNWLVLRDECDRRWDKYMKQVRLHQMEREKVKKLRAILSWVKRTEGAQEWSGETLTYRGVKKC